MLRAYVVSSQHSQMEGQKLQGDDTEDALQTVHSMWQLYGLIGVLSHVLVVLATQDDGPTLLTRIIDQRFYKKIFMIFLSGFNDR